MMTFRKSPGDLAAFLIAAIPLLLLFAWVADIAVENFWMVRAFDADESGVLADIQTMFHNQTWRPVTYIYGTAHTYLVLVVLKGIALVREVSFADIAIVSRAVNLAALLGIGLLFTLRRSTLRPKWLLLFLVALFFTQINFRYAANSKPEHLQLLFLVAALFTFEAFLKNGRLLWLFGAALLAGLVFATKYAGLLLIAFLWPAALIDGLARRGQLGAFLKEAARRTLIMSCGFLAGVLLLGPYLLIDFATVRDVLQAQAGVMRSGYFFTDTLWQDWFATLFDKDVFWWGLAVGSLPGALLLFSRGARWREDWLRRGLFLFWVFFYCAYLLLIVREQPPRYLIVILPFLFHAVFVSLASVEDYLEKTALRRVRLLVFGAATIAVITVAAGGWQHAAGLRDRADADRLAAGEWLLAQASTDKIIASDLYTYVPPAFRRHYHQLYLTAYDVLSVQPDYVVTSRAIMNRYLDIEKRTVYREGETAFMRHYYLYAKLAEGTFPGYRLLRDFDEVRIYRKQR